MTLCHAGMPDSPLLSAAWACLSRLLHAPSVCCMGMPLPSAACPFCLLHACSFYLLHACPFRLLHACPFRLLHALSVWYMPLQTACPCSRRKGHAHAADGRAMPMQQTAACPFRLLHAPSVCCMPLPSAACPYRLLRAPTVCCVGIPLLVLNGASSCINAHGMEAASLQCCSSGVRVQHGLWTMASGLLPIVPRSCAAVSE